MGALAMSHAESDVVTADATFAVGPAEAPHRYVIGELLGKGAAGEVYAATVRDSEVKVAMKTLPSGREKNEVKAMAACAGADSRALTLISEDSSWFHRLID